jgi:hypothetical protein
MKRRFAGDRSEAGETLIEVLLSSALMVIVVVTVIGGISTMLLASTLHREQADANAVLVGAMEQVKSPDLDLRCEDNNSSHPYRGGTPPLASTITIEAVEYQTIVSNADGDPEVVWSSDKADCSLPSPTSPLTLQRITLQYTSSGSNVDPELSFVKGLH